MARAPFTLTLALAIALGAVLGGCENDSNTAPGKRSLWPTVSAPDPNGGASGGNQARAGTASPPATAATPPPVVAPVEPLAEPAAKIPGVILPNDPMVLKKALQDGEAMSVSLPREAMARLFRTLAAFQPTDRQLAIIEAYGRTLAGPEQARLHYELQSCQTARTCVVVPRR